MTAPEVLIGGRYRLVRRLAAGGMGSVWEAWDERLQRPVAVKQLLVQPGLSRADAELASNRAMREARITARLHHPHAVPVYDVVDQDGLPCLIMQYLPSTSLQAMLRDKGTLEPGVVARIGAEVASALAAAHEVGIVHRDVKPGNVLIAEDGSAKLTDFGVSHAVGDVNLTSTGLVTGTPAFLAPEVARGAEAAAAADVFSLGATLYAALEGTPPFGSDENPMAVLHKVASGNLIPPRQSGPLAPLLLRMLAADPAARPPMLDVARTLTALSADLEAHPLPAAAAAAAATTQRFATPAPIARPPAQPTAAMPVRPAPRPVAPPVPAADRGSGRRVGVWLVALAVLLALAILIGYLVLGRTGNGNNPGSPAAPVASTTPSGSPPPSSAPATSAPPSSSTPPSSQPVQSPTQASSAAPTSNPAHSQSHGKPPNAAPTADQLAQAITDYYGLLPSNTDAGWARLTPSYQHGTAKNRKAYQDFWDSIDRVSATNVTGSPPSDAQATITYYFKDGRVVVEQTAFGLVQDHGTLKIDSSQVLSSQTQ